MVRKIIEHTDSTAYCATCDTDMTQAWDVCRCTQNLPDLRGLFSQLEKELHAIHKQRKNTTRVLTYDNRKPFKDS